MKSEIGNRKSEIKIAGELLFTMKSKRDWINKVPGIIPKKKSLGESLIWVDTKGNVLTCGEDFSAAENLDTYPVSVYRLVRASDLEKDMI